MNVRKIKYNKHHQPKSITVSMSAAEAATIAVMMGKHSPATFEELYSDLDWSNLEEVYGSLIGEFFNKHWDAGVYGFLRGDEE